MLPVSYTRADDRRQVTTRLGCEEKLREPRLSGTAVAACRNERLKRAHTIICSLKLTFPCAAVQSLQAHHMNGENIVFGAVITVICIVFIGECPS